MTRENPTWFVEPDSEIDQMIHRRLRGTTGGSTSRSIEIEDRESSIIAEQRRTIFDYERPWFPGEVFSVQAAAVSANNFDLAHLIRMIQNIVQFDGASR